MSVIAVSNLKGGTAKTTVAVHLARLVALRNAKSKPLLLDVDHPSGTGRYKRYLRGVELRSIEPESLAEVVAGNRSRVIVIDCPPSYIEACKAFEVARLILIPMAASLTAIDKTQSLLELLEQDFPRVPARVLITLFSRTDGARIATETAARKFKGRLLSTRLSRHAAVENAMLAGKTVFDFMPESLPARQFGRLGDELGLKI